MTKLAGNKNSKVTNPKNQNHIFGIVPSFNLGNGIITPEAPIILKVGHHIYKTKSGFGVNHIWAGHKNEIITAGYNNIEDVAQFVGDIIVPGTDIFCEKIGWSNGHICNVLQSSLGIVILELQKNDEYSVISAYTRKQSRGTLVGKIL